MTPVHHALREVARGGKLSREDARRAVASLLDDEVPPAVAGGFLASLAAAGETIEALAGAVDVLPTPHRSYRHGIWASHLLGYMNEVGPEELVKLNAEIEKAGGDLQPYQARDFVGRRGLEKRFERDLRGVDGTQRVVVDARGNAKRDSDLIPEGQRFEPSYPGNNLVLSIDWRLQELAEKAFPATAGAVIAMDAKTGFLLALVDRPSPDPNKMSGRITAAELVAIRSGGTSAGAPSSFDFTPLAWFMTVQAGQITKFEQVWTP